MESSRKPLGPGVINRKAYSLSSLKQKTGSFSFLTNPVPVPVTVTRERPPLREIPTEDVNNNRTRNLIHPPDPEEDTSKTGIPVFSWFLATAMLLVFICKQKMGISKEEEVSCSWKSVIEGGESGRVLYAQLFHFHRIPLFFSICGLVGTGRGNERKLTTIAYAIILLLLSVLSNIIYILMSPFVCSGYTEEQNVGFNMALVGLKMIDIFTKDPDANRGAGEPNLIFGVVPVHLPRFISPWQPIIESMLFEMVIIGKCVASSISGVLASTLFPILLKTFPKFIMRPTPALRPAIVLPRSRPPNHGATYGYSARYNNVFDPIEYDDSND